MTRVRTDPDSEVGSELGRAVVEVSAATFRQALDRTRRHDYRRWAEQVDTTGGCSRPVRLERVC